MLSATLTQPYIFLLLFLIGAIAAFLYEIIVFIKLFLEHKLNIKKEKLLLGTDGHGKPEGSSLKFTIPDNSLNSRPNAGGKEQKKAEGTPTVFFIYSRLMPALLDFSFIMLLLFAYIYAMQFSNYGQAGVFTVLIMLFAFFITQITCGRIIRSFLKYVYNLTLKCYNITRRYLVAKYSARAKKRNIKRELKFKKLQQARSRKDKIYIINYFNKRRKKAKNRLKELEKKHDRTKG